MTLWQYIEFSAGMPGQLHWLVLGFLAVVGLVAYFLPAERAPLRSVLFLALLALAGLTLAGVLRYTGALGTDGLSYAWLCGVSLFVGSIALINTASILIFAVLLHVARLEPSRIAQDFLVALAYVVVAITLLTRGGVDLRGIVATSAIITAVLGFSLQDTLGNIMSGMALQLERTIRVGDYVRIDDVEGRVVDIRWRHTSVETGDWDTVVIPNSVLMKGRFRVLGRRLLSPQQRRRVIVFNVDFRYSPTEVVEIVEREIRDGAVPNVAAEPAPQCLLMEFKESYATYHFRFWVADINVTDSTDSLVRTRIYASLRREGVPLSIPAQSVFVTKDNSSHRARKLHLETEHRLEALARIDVLRPLGEPERQTLAADMVSTPFLKGETIIRQGAEGDFIYIICDGEAEVRLTVGDYTRRVATLRRGDFFGEMALMTGNPRSSSVIAVSDVDCYRLGPQSLREVIKQRPEITEQISHLLAARRLELDGLLEEVSAEALRERLHHTQTTLLARLRRVFHVEGGGAEPD